MRGLEIVADWCLYLQEMCAGGKEYSVYDAYACN